MRGLYAIVDLEILDSRDIEPLRFAQAVLEAKPVALQVREKRARSEAVLRLLRALSPLARAAGTYLFANDRADLAALAGCDGVHVGQDDTPVEAARQVGDATGTPLRVGLSVHDEEQLERALDGPRLDYLALGPVFPTTSKQNPDAVLGVDRVARLSARLRAKVPSLPIVAIGGIDVERATLLREHVDAVAVIGALLPDAADPYSAATLAALALTEAFS
ncbi:thiamine phosphate synthase [Endomicrobium sp. AH-315-J14]|nr:thiamine phosphate synthase [Endomicrobium sp. AH-315-J14]